MTKQRFYRKLKQILGLDEDAEKQELREEVKNLKKEVKSER